MALVLYNGGRVISYSLIGLLFGIAGRGFYLAGMQRWFSIGAGILMLLLTVQYFLRKTTPRMYWLDPLYRLVQGTINKYMRAPGMKSYFVM